MACCVTLDICSLGTCGWVDYLSEQDPLPACWCWPLGSGAQCGGEGRPLHVAPPLPTHPRPAAPWSALGLAVGSLGPMSEVGSQRRCAVAVSGLPIGGGRRCSATDPTLWK